MTRTGIRAAISGALVALWCAGAAAEAPQRVVSLNLCTDQLAMLLAAPGQLVSVSHLARDPRSSAMVEEAARIPVNHGLAEEAFLLAPDLVLAGAFTRRSTLDMLRRLGVKVVEFPPAGSLDDVRALILRMGETLGRSAAADQLVARFDADLAALETEAADRPRAALYYANTVTMGAGTLANAIVEAAGLTNVAVDLGYDGPARMPLEILVMETPDLIVTDAAALAPARAHETLGHPALRALRDAAGAAPTVDRDWVCGTPFVLVAARRLSAARDALAMRR